MVNQAASLLVCKSKWVSSKLFSAHGQTKLHAFVVVAEDAGNGTYGRVDLSENGTDGVCHREELVGIIEDAQVGAVHTYGTVLVHESKRALQLEGLVLAIERVVAG